VWFARALTPERPNTLSDVTLTPSKTVEGAHTARHTHMEFDFSQEQVAPTEQAVEADAKSAGNFDAQRGVRLLMLYQFYPWLAKRDLIFLVLARALMTLPSSDFAACLALIPDRLVCSPCYPFLLPFFPSLLALAMHSFPQSR